MKFQVYTRSTPYDRAHGTDQSFIVTDCPDDWDGDQPWPFVAEFPVTMRYAEEEQRQRAHEYCAYMNSKAVIHPPIGT